MNIFNQNWGHNCYYRHVQEGPNLDSRPYEGPAAWHVCQICRTEVWGSLFHHRWPLDRKSKRWCKTKTNLRHFSCHIRKHRHLHIECGYLGIWIVQCYVVAHCWTTWLGTQFGYSLQEWKTRWGLVVRISPKSTRDNLTNTCPYTCNEPDCGGQLFHNSSWHSKDQSGLLMECRWDGHSIHPQSCEGMRTVPSRVSNSRENITMMACINVMGTAMPPLLVFKWKPGSRWSNWILQQPH
jgi:hypothetical protein